VFLVKIIEENRLLPVRNLNPIPVAIDDNLRQSWLDALRRFSANRILCTKVKHNTNAPNNIEGRLPFKKFKKELKLILI
jgi:hypothetical protein